MVTDGERWRWYRPRAEKPCYACKEVKPADQFATDRSKADERKSICRSCDSARGSAYYAKRKREGVSA